MPSIAPPAASRTASRCAASSGPGSTTQPAARYVFVPSRVIGDGLFARTRATPSGSRSSTPPTYRVPRRGQGRPCVAGLARQAELVRAGEVSSRELVELYLERIERIDPQLNSYRIVMAER